MGVEHGFMETLCTWSAALTDKPALEKLAEQPGRTPASFAYLDVFPNWKGQKTPALSPNQRALVAAIALVDAVHLHRKGTDEGRAIQLCEEILEKQAALGIMTTGVKGTEALTSSHGQLWAAAHAAILYVAWKRNIEGLLASTSALWRSLLDIWADHWTGESVLVPCGRGAKPGNLSLAVNEAVDLIHLFVQRGKKRNIAPQNRYMTGPRLFYLMEDVPLPKSQQYGLSNLLERFAYADGKFVSRFRSLAGFNVQWMVGTTPERPERAHEIPKNPGAWCVIAEREGEMKGGLCPEEVPDGWEERKAYPMVSAHGKAAAMAAMIENGDDEEEGHDGEDD